MTQSIRLHHPQFANCNYVIEIPDEEMPADVRVCNVCKVKHARKSIHLRLDSNGDVFVAQGIYEKLLKAGLGGMEVIEGRNAPPQVVGAVDMPQHEVITANDRFYVPERNKYESSKITEAPFRPILEHLNTELDKEKTKKLKEKRSIFILGKRKDG